MTSWREVARMIGLKVPHWKAHALDYLESRGQVFCVHFGTDNAVEKARQDWSDRKHNRARASIDKVTSAEP